MLDKDVGRRAIRKILERKKAMEIENDRKKIIRNAIRCKKCNMVIESESVHEFRQCQCGACAVDGGHAYLKRCGNPEDIEDISILE